MPLYTHACINGHSRDIYHHNPDSRDLGLALCECGETMTPRLSFGRALTFFEEGRGRWIENLDPAGPVYVTSHAQHQRLMRQHGREWVPPARGTPGCWT